MSAEDKPQALAPLRKKQPNATYRITAPGDTVAEQMSETHVVSNAFDPEDEFRNFYLGQDRSVGAIVPPYDLKTLDRLSQENNALSPCIEAMVTNIDGTGFDILKPQKDSNADAVDSESDATIEKLWDFFREPYEGTSFISIRKELRRDRERTGNAYLEILRTPAREMVMCKHVDAKMIRLIRLDAAYPKEVKVRRRGKEVTLTVMTRYRKFVQLVSGKQLVYFKEYGCPIDLNKNTGEWATVEKPVPIAERATELMHFTVLPDAHTPYGIPRWISQLPSVLGSRKAEEFNLEYFDAGGVPPVMILMQGGSLSPESRKNIETRTVGSARSKQRVQVIEMENTGGSIENPNSGGKVTVERFGSEQVRDSLFEKYDQKCEERVRRAFRLPALFVGLSGGHSFASAYTSYSLAEAQVFRPERDEFDAEISVKLLPELGGAGYKMASKAMAIEDATLKLQGIELAQKTEQVDAEVLTGEINKTVGTNLTVSKTLPVPQIAAAEAAKEASKAKAAAGANGDGLPTNKNTKARPKSTPVKSPGVTKHDSPIDSIIALMRSLSPEETDILHKELDGLDLTAPQEDPEISPVVN